MIIWCHLNSADAVRRCDTNCLPGMIRHQKHICQIRSIFHSCLIRRIVFPLICLCRWSFCRSRKAIHFISSFRTNPMPSRLASPRVMVIKHMLKEMARCCRLQILMKRPICRIRSKCTSAYDQDFFRRWKLLESWAFLLHKVDSLFLSH
jgi:hypothetical protein